MNLTLTTVIRRKIFQPFPFTYDIGVMENDMCPLFTLLAHPHKKLFHEIATNTSRRPTQMMSNHSLSSCSISSAVSFMRVGEDDGPISGSRDRGVTAPGDIKFASSTSCILQVTGPSGRRGNLTYSTRVKRLHRAGSSRTISSSCLAKPCTP